MNAKHRWVAFFAALWILLISFAAWATTPFAIVGDSHVGARNSVYATAIEQLRERGVSTVIHIGDAIDTPGSSKQWKRFLDMTGQNMTLHLAPGNHDIRGKRSLEVCLRFFPKPYYSFPDGDTLFVLLNTELPGEEGMVTGEQFLWLSKELDKPYRYKFVFLHEPLYPVVQLHGLDRYEEARDRLHRLFVEKKVSLVMAGHDHIYKRAVKSGIIYVIVPQLGGWLPPSFLANGNPSFGYIMAERKGGRYSFAVLDLNGKVKDRFFVKR